MVGEKLPLCILGKSSQPRCFSKYDMDTHDILYGSNKAAWMTKDLFSEWLSQINNIMIASNRTILLTLDNATCHHVGSLSNVKLQLIPPNTSALIQPLDMGIIKVIKDLYKQKLSSFIISQLESDFEINLNEIKLIDTIIWLYHSWLELEKTTIINCWRKSVLKFKQYTDVICGEDEEIKEDLENGEDDNILENEELPCFSMSPMVIDSAKKIQFEETYEIGASLNGDEIMKIKKGLNFIRGKFKNINLGIYNNILNLESIINKMLINCEKKRDMRLWLIKKEVKKEDYKEE